MITEKETKHWNLFGNLNNGNNDDTITTENNNDETNSNKEPSSLSNIVTLHAMFSEDYYDDVDRMNATKNDVLTLAKNAKKTITLKKIKSKLSIMKMIILCTQRIQLIMVATRKKLTSVVMLLI